MATEILQVSDPAHEPPETEWLANFTKRSRVLVRVKRDVIDISRVREGGEMLIEFFFLTVYINMNQNIVLIRYMCGILTSVASSLTKQPMILELLCLPKHAIKKLQVLLQSHKCFEMHIRLWRHL